ncbi:MAG: TldD/PmbA family protein [Acidimicrobiales bacterium]
MADPLQLCDDVLEAVGSRAEAEVTVGVGRSALTRFANSHIHQNVAEDEVWTRLRLCADGRLASATSTRAGLDPRALAERTLEAAGLRPVDPDWPGLAPVAPATAVDHFDPATDQARPEERAEVVRRFVDAGGPQLSGAGFCDTDSGMVAFANSAGQRLSGSSSRATIEGIHRTGTSDGRGWQSSSRLGDLDGGAAGTVAARKALDGAQPVEVPPGRYEVVLEPACAADIVDFLSWYGFNAKSHAEGQSFVRLGEAQLDPAVSLVDDATDPRALGLAFDAEGTPRRRLELVRHGVCVALAHDRRTARGAGAESTGHAVHGGESWGPMCGNVFFQPGLGTPADLVANVERGLLVTELWYTRILDPKTQVVTGLTRNGTFLIEGGRVVGAVRNLRFTQSYVDALGPGNVLGVGADQRLAVSGSWVPSLHLASWNFTGGSQG